MTRRETFIATVLDADLQGIRARYEARLGAERARIAAEQQRARDAATAAQREAQIEVRRAVAQARCDE